MKITRQKIKTKTSYGAAESSKVIYPTTSGSGSAAITAVECTLK